MSDWVLYDFDGTLTRRDTTRHLFRAFWRFYPGRGIVSLPQVLRMLIARQSPDRLQIAKIRVLGRLFQGLRPEDLVPVMAAYKKLVLPYLRQRVLSTIEMHRQDGRRIVVVTASPRIAVQEIFSDVPVIGSEFEVVRGRYTGNLSGPMCYGAYKVDHILSWKPMLRDGGRVVEAWSDSWSDRPMMSLAGKRNWVCTRTSEVEFIQRQDPLGSALLDLS